MVSFFPPLQIPLLISASRYDLRVATTNNFDTVTVDQPQPLPPSLPPAASPNVPGRTELVEPPRVHAGRAKFGAALRWLRH